MRTTELPDEIPVGTRLRGTTINRLNFPRGPQIGFMARKAQRFWMIPVRCQGCKTVNLWHRSYWELDIPIET
jgi:hypothetical protein